jgi:hypothetical protein
MTRDEALEAVAEAARKAERMLDEARDWITTSGAPHPSTINDQIWPVQKEVRDALARLHAVQPDDGWLPISVTPPEREWIWLYLVYSDHEEIMPFTGSHAALDGWPAVSWQRVVIPPPPAPAKEAKRTVDALAGKWGQLVVDVANKMLADGRSEGDAAAHTAIAAIARSCPEPIINEMMEVRAKEVAGLHMADQIRRMLLVFADAIERGGRGDG